MSVSEVSTEKGISTKIIEAAVQSNPYESLHMPQVDTATFTFEDTQAVIDYNEAEIRGEHPGRGEYGRYGNPTIDACENALARIENAEAALLVPSGMSAITTVLLEFLQQGDHIVVGSDCYRRTRQFCTEFLGKRGVETTIVPMGDYDALREAVRPKTKILLSESPTNPYLRVVDLERFTEIGRASGALTVIDSTFATPVNQRPSEWGVDLIIHSATKYLAGHNNMLAGVVAGKSEHVERVKKLRGILGNMPAVSCASDLLKDVHTLGLRVERQNRSTQEIAEFLEKHPAIERVWYPGLASHPDHEIAKQQMSGFGGVVSFQVHGGFDEARTVVDSVVIPKIAPSLGGTISLIEQPTVMSFWSYKPEVRRQLGIYDNLIRFAVGIEDSRDLIADLSQALDKLGA